MDYTFNKTLLVILSLSSLLLSSNAIPSTRVIDIFSTSVPTAAPKSSAIDFTSTSFPAKAPSSIDFISKVVTKVDPEIKNICNEGGDKTTRCIETLSKLFQGPFDVVKALEIEVNATLSTAKAIFDNIITLLHDPSTDKRAIDAIDICREEYDLMLDSIKKALECIPQKYFADAYNAMCSVISYKSSCQLGWDESPEVAKPWDEETLIQSTVICVDILNYIVNNRKF